MTARAGISDLARAFEDGTLDPAGFGHVGHLQVAYDLLRTRDFFEATAIYARGIRALAARAGRPDKFNATITGAFLCLMAERLENSGASDFESFLAENPDLRSMRVLDRWYGPERLHSQPARRAFLMPEAADAR